MYFHNDKWYSSFLGLNDHPEGISTDLQVLTIRSGRIKENQKIAGGHVSMYLEMTVPGQPTCIVTQVIQLVAGEEGAEPMITFEWLQLSNLQGVLTKDKLHEKSSVEDLMNTHHACYKIDSSKSASIIAAAQRFSDKAKSGRYTYKLSGGVKARLRTRPGTRGVNCADFVIKILNEAGIAKLGYKYTSTPYRIATQL